MGWTSSATGRERLAVSSLTAAPWRHASKTLDTLGKGDASRGALTALAGLLAVCGAALPLLPAAATSLILLTASITLMMMVASHRQAASRATIADDATGDATAAVERRLTPAPTLFAEFFLRADAPTLADRAALARLTAQMSHELRTPLNAVIGFSEIMANEVCGPLGSSCYAGYAKDIHASGRKLLKISEDALAITSLLTSSDRRAIDTGISLESAIEDAIAFHAADLDRLGIALQHRPLDDAAVLADVQTVRQLVVNLIADLAVTAAPGSLLTVTEIAAGEMIEVDIELAGPRLDRQPEADGFSLTLARTLAELAGSPLVEATASDGTRTLKVSFTSAAQRDFFAN